MTLKLNGTNSVAAPAYAGDDADTGLQCGTDELKLVTGGSARATVDSSGNVGIGTTSPSSKTHIKGGSLTVEHASPSTGTCQFNINSENNSQVSFSYDDQGSIVIGTAATPTNQGSFSEKLRIDSSGQIQVGTNLTKTDVASTVAALVQTRFSGSFTNYSAIRESGPATFCFGRANGSGSQVLSNNDEIGAIRWAGADGTDLESQAANISCQVDGTPGANDMPGRLVFSTTANGSSSTTERARITEQGYAKFSPDGTYVVATGGFHEFSGTNNGTQTVIVKNRGASFAYRMLDLNAVRAGNSAFGFLRAYSGNYGDLKFNLRGDGNAYADGSWNGGGADYAEYFEWSDGNTASEDRRGISVVLDGDKIREAVAGEEPIGVISANPSVVGDADIEQWKGKYLRDDYGTYIEEDYEVEDEDGNTVVQQRRQLNPDYNPDTEYVTRENRAEWDTVGLMGKLRIRKGQVTGTRWIKMRDVSDTVEEWLVR